MRNPKWPSKHHSLATLDVIQKRAIKLIKDAILKRPPSTRWPNEEAFRAFSFIQILLGMCSDELKLIKIIRLKVCFAAFTNSQHLFAIELFITKTSRNWNSFLVSVFPDMYYLQTFMSRITDAFVSTLSIDYLFLLLLGNSRVFQYLQGIPLVAFTSNKNKKIKKRKNI